MCVSCHISLVVHSTNIYLCKATLGNCRSALFYNCWHLAGQGLWSIVVPRFPQHCCEQVSRAFGCQGLLNIGVPKFQCISLQDLRYLSLLGCILQLQTCDALQLLALCRTRSQEHWGAKGLLSHGLRSIGWHLSTLGLRSIKVPKSVQH